MSEVAFNDKLRTCYFEVTGDVKYEKGDEMNAYIDERATELGLRGWVNCTMDGSVEGYAEGTLPQLDALRNLLLPGECKVTDIETASFGFEECLDSYSIDEGFEIQDINSDPYVSRKYTDLTPIFDEPFEDGWKPEDEAPLPMPFEVPEFDDDMEDP